MRLALAFIALTLTACPSTLQGEASDARAESPSPVDIAADLVDVPIAPMDVVTDLSEVAADAALDAPTDRGLDAPTDRGLDSVADVSADQPPDAPDVVCSAPLTRCGSECVDPRSDVRNCGACGLQCPVGQPCVGGRCGDFCDRPGLSLCAGSCVDLATDNTNCGACGSLCPAGRICSMGVCQCPCPSGLSCCGGTCRDLSTDHSNCGSCGSACPAGALCSAGTCFASDCPRGGFCGGTCHDFGTDGANCGGCDRPCAVGELCYLGVCLGPGAIPPFEAVAPCNTSSEYRPGDTVQLAGTLFTPRCLAVRAGAAVTFRFPFDVDPLAPATTRGSPGNPIPTTRSGASVTVTFPATGYFPYYSLTHGSADGSGLAGVVYVVR